jgi:hypothetical protein
MATVFSVLTLYSWALVGALIYILYQIARFYQAKYAELYRDRARQRTYAALFWIPLVLFPLAAGRYVMAENAVGDLLGDMAFLLGGVVLAAASYRLYRLMMGGRR